MRYGLGGFHEVGGRRPLFCAQMGALVRKETRMKRFIIALDILGLATSAMRVVLFLIMLSLDSFANLFPRKYKRRFAESAVLALTAS